MNIFRKSKKLFKTLAMMLAMLIIAPSFGVFAVEINSTDGESYLKYDSPTWGKVLPIGNHRYYAPDLRTCYCLNTGALNPTGQDYTEEMKVDGGIETILYWGYPSKDGSEWGISADEYRYCTQLAIWSYQFEAGISRGMDRTRLKNGTVSVSRLKPVIDFLVEKAHSRELPKFFDVTPNTVNATENGDYLVSEPIQIKSDYSFNDARVSVKSTSDPSLKDRIKIMDMNGNERNLFNSNEKFKVYIPKNAKTGELKIKVNARIPVPAVVGYKTPVAGKQDMAIVPMETQNFDVDNVTVNWTALTGNLKVIKTGDNGELLAGAKFQLKDMNGTVVGEKVSENGELTFTDIMGGEYILEEVESPKGFLKAEPVKVTVRAGETTEINVVDTQIKGRVEITKIDEETGEPLEGAEFEMVKADTNEVVENMTTKENGKITSGLHPFGDYIIREIKAPNKYTLNGKEYPVTISEHMQTIEITHSNRIIKGRVAINKFDSEFTDLKLKDAEFTIYDKNDTEVDKLITDENGYDESIELNYGDYTMKETKAPAGHKLSDKVYDIQIREDKKVYTFDVPNDVIKGQIQIVKVDSENEEKPVEGAGFDVEAVKVDGIETGTVVDYAVTDKDGFAFTKPLRYGEYKFIETKTPNGYWQSDREYHVNITEDNKIYVKYVKNEPIRAKLRVVKTDSKDNTPIEGVKFQIRNTDTNELVTFKNFVGILPVPTKILTTDKNGEILTPQNLEYGNYVLEEAEPKEGYVGIEPIPFKIDENAPLEDIKDLGTIYTIKVSNDRITGDVELLKVDSETKEPLADVNFKFTCIDGFMKDQTWDLTSNEDGKINLKGLEYGKYRVDEVSTLWNYVLNKEPIYFEIKENGQVVKLEMENKKIRANVELIKIDAYTKRPLEGGVFELWNGEKLVGEYTTNKDGKISLENLEAGNYYWKEVKAPNNYILDEDKALNFEIIEDGKTITTTVENKVETGDVDFTKTDVTTGENIEGAKIEIVGLEEHNKHIKIEFDSSLEGNKFKLPVGKYQFKEIQAPNGYELSTEVGEFEVKADEVIKANLKNERTTGVLEFTKTDVATGEVLEGAKIKIECLEGLDQGKIIEFTSSKEGNKFNLSKGKYRISETQAPSGYELTTETGEFEITEHGQVIKCNLTNKKFEIVKTGGAFNVNMMLPLGLLLVAGSLGALAFTKRKRA
ncbi:TPA: Cys-Gln thioester bond-forming surface protein [Clostridium perfringens]|uniref:Adhesin n=2 Tax=Clostridium perfringens TaxID=1502 RepID=A0AB37C6M7_CLOPF|nr:Cys-Gln thioester bond-forming surface protein [Clostridium perfringens]PWX39539.1 adhesin [Clostridium perfringens]HAT4304976.1 Cys-Gln thioester bond-forming surface protein [Clostridium perfringens]HAT4322139.1 Cys-Gln thioester bond-forming surface protein [Clostridium perfringens]HAT4335380.1 Cys-Gln thioester bond-forming surface protein [Clostridium perfringens]